MVAKTNYYIRFFKTVVGDYGSDAEICQREVAVAADSRESAAKRGIRQFCRTERLKNWTDHADRYAVELIRHDGAASPTHDRSKSPRPTGELRP